MNQLLGRGPVAEVYAVDGRAVKVFPGRFDRRTLAAIRRDRSKLAHAPVLPFDGVELFGGRHVLHMELCRESLASRVRREGPLPSEDVAALCVVLFRALAAAHRLGVLHGGISPTNVLFRATGEVVLADFGLAQRQAFRRDPVRGIEWAPPETLRTGTVDTRTDLYGLGAVLHFALTGESPHPSRIGELTGERILRVLSDPVPAVSRPDVPIALSTTIGRLLAPDPAKRSAPWPANALELSSSRGSRVWRWSGSAVVFVAVLAVIPWPRTAPASVRDTVPAAAPTTRPAPTVTLNRPVDRGDTVSLSWTATDDRLNFFVLSWVEGEGTVEAEPAWRNHNWIVRVEPGRKYCFRVQAAGLAAPVVESEARAVREANCDG